VTRFEQASHSLFFYRALRLMRNNGLWYIVDYSGGSAQTMYRGDVDHVHAETPGDVVFTTVSANGAREPACTVQVEACGKHEEL
jgi:hypothetical protein